MKCKREKFTRKSAWCYYSREISNSEHLKSVTIMCHAQSSDTHTHTYIYFYIHETKNEPACQYICVIRIINKRNILLTLFDVSVE